MNAIILNASLIVEIVKEFADVTQACWEIKYVILTALLNPVHLITEIVILINVNALRAI